MKFPLVLASIALTFLCWGAYGPVLHEGQAELGVPLRPSGLRPFICVGIAYFVIAVIVPIIVLRTKGEKGSWTTGGTIWSFAAGLVTALGALGIVLAFKFRGNPIYVMPLVFGCAPVVNTFVTMAMSRTFKEAGAIFYAGVLLAAIGAAGVMFFRPLKNTVETVDLKAGQTVASYEASQEEKGKASHGTVVYKHADDEVTVVARDEHGTETRWGPVTTDQLNDKEYEKARGIYNRTLPLTPTQFMQVLASIALTAVCWGAYGPMLHKGQMKMGGSRMRPFLCVGLAYFLIAVVVPIAISPAFPEPGEWTVSGTIWSLAGGALGAIGALGIVMAFNFGGKPLMVMPLVFGCAPLINTAITVAEEGTMSNLTLPFFGSLVLAIIGAVTVLMFAPKGHPPAKGPEGK
jgi:hypothetical protein